MKKIIATFATLAALSSAALAADNSNSTRSDVFADRTGPADHIVPVNDGPAVMTKYHVQGGSLVIDQLNQRDKSSD